MNVFSGLVAGVLGLVAGVLSVLVEVASGWQAWFLSW